MGSWKFGGRVPDWGRITNSFGGVERGGPGCVPAEASCCSCCCGAASHDSNLISFLTLRWNVMGISEVLESTTSLVAVKPLEMRPNLIQAVLNWKVGPMTTPLILRRSGCFPPCSSHWNSSLNSPSSRELKEIC